MLRLNIPQAVILIQKNSFFFFKGPLNSWLCLPKSLCIRIVSNILVLNSFNKKQKKFSYFTLIRTLFHSISSKLRLLALGYSKVLILQGVGFRFTVDAANLFLFVGFSAPVVIKIPKILNVQPLSKTSFKIQGPNKDKVNAFAFYLQKFRFPDQYKGKGILLAGQVVSLKQQSKA